MNNVTADMSLQESCIDAARHLSVEVHLLASKVDELERENAKLRELCADLYAIRDKSGIYHVTALQVRLDELGVEVD